MEIAKLMSKGQVTIPINIRKKLNLEEGDKIVFLEKDGNILIANSDMLALKNVQNKFAGAEPNNGNDVINLIREFRREIEAQETGAK